MNERRHRFDLYRKRVGRTSLSEVPGPKGKGRIFAKLEYENPNQTVKDRVSIALLEDLVDRYAASRDSVTVLEYTGGTLGSGLARLCQEMNFRCILVASSATDGQVLRQWREYNAETVLVEKDLGFYALIEKAMEIKNQNPTYHFLYQHTHPKNLAVHRHETGREILQSWGKLELKSWVASIGTGGTLMGVAQALREKLPQLRVIATTPAEMPFGTTDPGNGKPKFAGSGGLGDGRKQPFVAAHESLLSEHRHFSFSETLHGAARFFAMTGEKIGTSAAANWLAAWREAETLSSEQAVCCVFPSRPTSKEWQQVEEEFLR